MKTQVAECLGELKKPRCDLEAIVPTKVDLQIIETIHGVGKSDDSILEVSSGIVWSGFWGTQIADRRCEVGRREGSGRHEEAQNTATKRKSVRWLVLRNVEI